MALPPSPDKWPLLLCGPILRRVAADSVSVFIVLKHPRRVTLKVLSGKGTIRSVVAEHTEPTRKLGKYLHALVITAKSSTSLNPNVFYSYNLEFTSLGDPEDRYPSPVDLRDSGPVFGKLILGYEDELIPSFFYPPPSDEVPMEYLKIVHASCLRPDAPKGGDVFPTLDTILEARWPDPLSRPHQLFLTGDQIYADDVHPALLRMATVVGAAAFGWPQLERLPGVFPVAATADTDHFVMAPGRRQELVHSRAGFSSREAACHLVSLAEYFGMYLLAWSDALWPHDTPGQITVPEDSEVFGHPDWGQEDPDKLNELKDEFRKTRARIVQHGRNLWRVRRALANVPCYMAFDDHEVTDDWFLHREWKDRTLALPLGVRIIQNALSAYAVFQAWGNDPAQFDATKAGGKLLAAIGSWDGGLDTLDATGKRIAERIASYLGLPSTLPQGDQMRWHYRVQWGGHQLIVLDTRTQRSYPTGNSMKWPGLINENAMALQIRGSPETGATEYPRQRLALSLVVSPAPVFGHTFVEGFIQPRLRKAVGPEIPDYEAWAFNPPAFHRILRELAPLERVIILSGDVHYSFAAQVQFWDEQQDERQSIRAAFAQCTSSPLRQELPPAAWWPRIMSPAQIPPSDVSFVCWSSWSRGDRLVEKQLPPQAGGNVELPFSDSPPAQLKVPAPHHRIRVPPHWRYRVRFVTDHRDANDRGTSVLLSQPSLPSGPLAEKINVGRDQRLKKEFGSMETVVTYNNICELSFLSLFATQQAVRQTCWFRPTADDVSSLDVRPYTVLDVPFDVPAADAQRPDEGHP